MLTCLECGNQDMRVRVAGGTPIHECALCGARFGDRDAIEALADAEEAKARGVSPLVWPLCRALDRLPGIVVREAHAGDADTRVLPFVEIGAASSDALVQLENLAKSLQLAAAELRGHWVVEVEFRRHLAFVLKPRHGGGSVGREQVRDAQLDLDVVRRHFERDGKLGWWRHAGTGRSG
ncbi:MAG: hypothetical protein JNK78_18400 [Planctomycetes bacterium]|nr:hypothetical protein [Planctomycetota bacterium]